MEISFNNSSSLENQIKYILDTLRTGKTSGDGKYTKKCNLIFEKELKIKKSLLTTSCTHALEMCALLLNIKPGDEVILPSYTFVSTVNAFLLRGAIPKFIDVKYSTLNIDENLIEDQITKNTKAIIVVHYAGVACEMGKIKKISLKYNIPIIEDNAHGIFGKYKNKFLGTFGTFSTQSFHETKNFSCGEGGALFINDENFMERAEYIREKGTNRTKFVRNEIDKYSWVDIGSSYLLSEILACILYAQLEMRNAIQQKRKLIWENYKKRLHDWAMQNDIKLQEIPPYCKSSYHIFYILLSSSEKRERLISHLKKRGIKASFHYTPLHTSLMGRKYGYKKGDLPVTEEISERMLRLPVHNNLKYNLIDFRCFYDFK